MESYLFLNYRKDVIFSVLGKSGSTLKKTIVKRMIWDQNAVGDFIRILVVLMIGLLTIINTYGQGMIKCDNIYQSVDFPAKYGDDESAFRRYLEKEFTPAVGGCMERGDELIASLYIVLTIDKTGKVIDASFPKQELTGQCKKELRQKLLQMSGWAPAKRKGKAVCSYYKCNIACMKWE